MAKYTKPNYAEQWASAGNIVAPNSAKIQAGHIVEKPNYEYMNWLQNRQDTAIAYSLQMGVPEWDNTTQYQYTFNSHASYVQRNGVVYKAIQTGTNKDPLTEAAYWTIAFDDKGMAAAVQSNLNTHITNYGTLTGLTDTATARTNLDVYSKTEAAQKNGSTSETFSVATATSADHAVRKEQLDAKADKNGSASETFSVDTATAAAHAVRKDQFDNTIAVTTPVGSVIAYAGTSIPSGWLECNGANVSRITYNALFSVIGTLYGVGNGSTTFTLPDLRGEFIRGFDNGRGVDTSRSIGSWQDDSFESHTHTVNSSAGLGDSTGGTNTVQQSAGSMTTSATGGTETRPRNVAMYYIIKV